MRCTVILEQEPDGGYVATVPALPGCIAQGDTRDEALKNIREAAELYIEDCIAAGDLVPTEAEREYFDLKTGTPIPAWSYLIISKSVLELSADSKPSRDHG